MVADVSEPEQDVRDIVLLTLNARYSHCALGLRYLLANLGELAPRAELLELTLEVRPLDVVAEVLRRRPRVLGVSVYIWNVVPLTQVVRLLKQLAPDIAVVLGGPEVSHELDRQQIVALADYVVTGEGDVAFASLAGSLLAGKRPLQKVIAGGLPNLAALTLPYALYSDDDLAHRTVYLEASRGCPYRCEFCLSALDKLVRPFPLDAFIEQLHGLLDRGLQRFKFVDRTFNLSIASSRRILDVFLERYRPGLFVHFEMIPDRLPAELREPLAAFPPGAVQLEIGIQSFDEAVCARISRRQDVPRALDNLRFLTERTGVHLHVDLIIGLPGEDKETFARGFDRLVAAGPQEIQIGFLKRLRGAPIARHDDEHGMVYDEAPPYEVLRTAVLSFEELMGLRRFARAWDLVVNNGRFATTAQWIWRGQRPFVAFERFSCWLFEQAGATHGISLTRLTTLLWRYLTEVCGLPQHDVAHSLVDDLGTDRVPAEILAVTGSARGSRRRGRDDALPERQRRHAAQRALSDDSA